MRRCYYAAKEDSLLRDRIVHGIVSESVRKRPLGKQDLTLEKCSSICRADAKTASQAQTMRRVLTSTPTVNELHAVRETPSGNATQTAPAVGKNESDNASRDSTSRPGLIDCHYCRLRSKPSLWSEALLGGLAPMLLLRRRRSFFSIVSDTPITSSSSKRPRMTTSKSNYWSSRILNRILFTRSGTLRLRFLRS